MTFHRAGSEVLSSSSSAILRSDLAARRTERVSKNYEDTTGSKALIGIPWRPRPKHRHSFQMCAELLLSPMN